jgi:thiol-disulfide isomerase/thioredoxin
MILPNATKGLKLMMKKSCSFLIVLLIFFSFSGFSAELNTGPWRFEVKTEFATIPFIINFEKKGQHYYATLLNGEETISLPKIIVQKNTLSIPLQIFEATLDLQLQNQQMTGELVRHNKKPKQTFPVSATYGISERFPGKKQAAATDLSGKWSVSMKDEGGKSTPGIVVFKQNQDELSGTILTPTGDYRYFQGYVSGHEFKAASFDGGYNYILQGEIKGDKLQAQILSTYKMELKGTKDNQASLPDAYNQTSLSKLEFKFPDLNKRIVTLKEKRFKNKPVIVQLFGSWCPNCLDEMNFLIPWYKANSKRGIEVIALAFERSLGEEEARRQLLKVKKKKQVPYLILQAGSTNDDKPADKISGLKNFSSFPTTIFLNKNHEVVKVHSGFSGPGTGPYYEEWKKEFESTVTDLLKN